MQIPHDESLWPTAHSPRKAGIKQFREALFVTLSALKLAQDFSPHAVTQKQARNRCRALKAQAIFHVALQIFLIHTEAAITIHP